MNDVGRRRIAALPVFATLAGLSALGLGLTTHYIAAVVLAGLGIAVLCVQVALGTRRPTERPLGSQSRTVPQATVAWAPHRLGVPAGPVETLVFAEAPVRVQHRPLADLPVRPLQEPVAVQDLVDLAVDSARPSALARHQRLVVATELGGAAVAGDAIALDRALVDLLADALRSTAAGGTITVSGHRGPGVVVVAVRTTGTASGRDLAGVRAIVARHGGRLDIESTSDGSARIVTLPALAQVA